MWTAISATVRSLGCLRLVQEADEAALAPIRVPAVQRLALCAIKRNHRPLHSVLCVLRSIINRLTRSANQCPNCPIPVAIDFALPEGAPMRLRRRDSFCHVLLLLLSLA